MKKILLTVALFFLCPTLLYSADVTLLWDPVIHPDLAGYRLYVSYASGLYSAQMMVDVGNVTTYTWTGLDGTKRNFFVATAYSIHGEESDYSNEVSAWGFSKPLNIRRK